MSCRTYLFGDPSSLSAEFRLGSSTGALYNPQAVIVRVTSPSGVESLPSVSNVSTGKFKATVFPLNERGVWSYRWEATDPVPERNANAEGSLLVG